MAASFDRHGQQKQQQRRQLSKQSMAVRPPLEDIVDDCASSGRSTYTGAATNTTNQGALTPVGPPQPPRPPRPPPQPLTPTIKTIQGDGVKLTIVKPNATGSDSRPKRQPQCLKIRTTRKYKQAQQQSQHLAVADRDSASKNSACSVHSLITSKLEKIMENQLVKFPYPLVTKCQTFLKKYPTFTGTYSLESSLGSHLVKQLMEELHWSDKCKLTEMEISLRSNHLVWGYDFSVSSGHGSAAHSEETILSRINSRIRISSKRGLYKLLWMNHSPHSPDDLQMNSVLPKTFLLHPMTDEFRKEIQRPGITWILKPSNYSQGTSLKLYKSSGDLKEFATLVQEHFKNFNAGDILVQRYIDDPLLVDKRKFDLRVFLLIVPHQEKNTLFAFYHPGFVRLTCRRYERDSETLTVHLTNLVLQKRDSRYDRVKEATTWTPGELNCYLNKRHGELGICPDWVHTRLHPRIKAILGYVVSLMKNMEVKGRRCFELFGCDFLIDSQMRVWLIDINSGPSLAMDTEVLQRLVPGVVQEAVGLALEVVFKSQKFNFIYPLVFQNNYALIFDGQTSTSLY